MLVNKPQEIILQDFIVKLLKLKDPITGQEYNTIFIIIDKFTKQEYFIAYIKEILVKDIVQIYIKKSVFKIQSTNQDYIRQRYKVYISILVNIYSRAKY